MFRLIASGLLLAALVAPAIGAPLPPSLKMPTQEEPKKNEEPNIGNLADWIRSSNLAEVRDGMFYIDALRAKDPVTVFRRDKILGNTTASFQFKVEPVGQGARAVGLIFGSTDGRTYHCIEIGRRDVVLYRVGPGGARTELDRRGGFTKPDGNWFEAKIECQGSLIRTFFDNKFLFAFTSPQLQPGYVGFYGFEGRSWVRRLDFEGKPAQLPQGWKP